MEQKSASSRAERVRGKAPSSASLQAGTKNSTERQCLAPGHTVGILEQEPELDDKKTVRQVVEEGVQETADALKEYNAINEKFAEPMSDDGMTKLIERQGRCRRNSMPWMHGNWIHVLKWHGCTALPSRRTPVNILSGGKNGVWPFAGSYFRSPDILLLDEPTKTISMPRQWHGLSTICKAIPAPSLL